jgi:hypothetical protein
MNKSAIVIGLLFGLGGALGLLNPREWTYTTANRHSVAPGSRVISKTGTRLLSLGAILIGTGSLWIGIKNGNQARERNEPTSLRSSALAEKFAVKTPRAG